MAENESKNYYDHPDQDPNSMIPHHESFGRHWLNRHHYLMWTMLFLLFAAVLSVVYWWQTDNFRIELPGTSISQNQDDQNSGMCVQSIARARNPQTGQTQAFPTPCDVPSGWTELEPGKPMAMVKMQGGLCVTGSMCETTVIFNDNGEYLVNHDLRADLTAAEVASLKAEVAKLNFAQLKSRPFIGTCPIAYDGQEHIYTFFDANGAQAQVLASCTYDLDETQGVFKLMWELVTKYEF
jgi:hypothetical protein